MKYIFSFFLLVPFSFLYSQSNLIKNPSLEEWKNGMPISWRVVTGSPDIFKSDLKIIPPGIQPEDKKYRNQFPDFGHDGLSYIGLSGNSKLSEIIEVSLSGKLKKGKEYRISCLVYMPQVGSKEPLREFTVSFSDTPMVSKTQAASVQNYYNLYQPDKTAPRDKNWHLVSTSFVAKGEENFMQLGFFNKNLPKGKKYYYLFDDFYLTELKKSVINRTVNYEKEELSLKDNYKKELTEFLSTLISIDSVIITGFTNEQDFENKKLDLFTKRSRELNNIIQKLRPGTKIIIDSKFGVDSKFKSAQTSDRINIKIFNSGITGLPENIIRFDSTLMLILKNLEQSDQYLRIQYDSLSKCCKIKQANKLVEINNMIRITDSLNILKIKEILVIYDYPGLSKVTPDYMNSIAKVLLHSDLKTMEAYLEMIKFEVDRGEVSPLSYAMLFDKIKILKNEEQVYGTQVRLNANTKKYEFYPVKDKSIANSKRNQIGLQSLDSYLETLNGVTAKPKVKKSKSRK